MHSKRLKENEIDHCSGCMACVYACPTGCIQMMTDAMGNFHRKINEQKCIGCNRCGTVCPMQRTDAGQYPEKAYIAWSRKREYRSSSGGIAAAIYRYALEVGAECVGVRWDKKLRAIYDWVTLETIESFVGSKYVYSHMGSIYEKISGRLEHGARIIFIGLPCHVAALQNIVARGNGKLLTIELVCHGVSPEKYLQEHLRGLQKKTKRADEYADIKFREKKNPFGLTVIGRKGEIIERQERMENEYMSGYCAGFTYLEACYACPYACENRCADLTIKDYCANPPKQCAGGASSVLVNTGQGATFWEEIKPYLEVIDDSVESVIVQDAMLRRPTPGKGRRLFATLYPIVGFDGAARLLCLPARLKNKTKKILEEYGQ